MLSKWIVVPGFLLATAGAAQANDLLQQFGQQLLNQAIQGAIGQRPPPGYDQPAPRIQRQQQRPVQSFGSGNPITPSFSCAKATSATARAICASSDLSQLDLQLADAYVAALQRATPEGRAALKVEQRGWVAARNQCGGAVDCIAGFMQQRIAALAGTPAAPSTNFGGLPDADATLGAQSSIGAAAEPAAGDVVDAGYKMLLQMMMDYRPDDYRTDDFALYWNSLNIASGSPQCDAAYKAMRNGALQTGYVAQARRNLDARLARSTGKPSVKALHMVTTVTMDVDDYDRQAQVFKIGPAASSRGGSFLQSTVEYSPEGIDRCSGSAARLTNWRGNSLSIFVTGGDKIVAIPMSLADANARFDRAANGDAGALTFRLDGVIATTVSDQGIAGRVVSATVSDSESGALLFRYDKSLFAGGDGGDAAQASAAPATPTVVALAVAHLRPETIDDNALASLTMQHITADQYAYEDVRRHGRSGTGQSEHVFTFEASEVEGRSAEFIAPTLAPKMRKLIDQVASQVPTHLWIERPLGKPIYDHARSTAHFRCCYIRDTGIPGDFDLMMPASVSYGANLHRPAPGEAPASAEFQKRAVYAFEMGDGDPPSQLVRLGREVLPSSRPSVILGLDRVLESADVPIAPDRMEAVMKRLEHGNVNDSVSSHVQFAIEGIADSPGNRELILLAHLEAVTLLDPDGKVLADLPLESFPLAVDRWKQETDAAAKAAADAQQVKADQATLAAKQQADSAAAAAEAGSKAAAGVEDAATAALSGAYGPDVVGLRLGMTFDEADAVIREHMEVGWVGRNDPVPLTAQPDPSIPVLSSMLTYVNKDRSEVIQLFDMPPDGTRRVLGVRRAFAVAEGTTDDDIATALVEKYGNPQKTGDNLAAWTWGDTKNPACSPPSDKTFTEPQIVEGPTLQVGEVLSPFSTNMVLRFVFGAGSGKLPDLARWASCGPVLQIIHSASQRVDVTLADNRLYAALMVKALRQNVQTAKPLKF